MMLTEDTVRFVSEKLSEPEWLLDRRLEAFKKFEELSFPKFKYGIRMQVDLSEFDINSVNPTNMGSNLVRAPKNVDVIPFSEAFDKYDNLLRDNFMTKCVLASENKFTALHAAFFGKALLVRIPADTVLDHPIEIHLDQTSRDMIDHILVIAEPNSKAVILESVKGDGYFRSQVVEVILQEGAKLDYRSIQDFSRNIHNFSKRKASLASDSCINWLDCYIGSKFTQSVTHNLLQGEGAESNAISVVFGDQDQNYDLYGASEHLVSHTKSNLLAKVVLNDTAKAMYRGLVKIHDKAEQCSGFQKQDTILLSNDARVDTVPVLEISNNDVKCSHGATVSQIDEEKLFYLMSRGLSEDAARRKIVEGFFDPILKQIGNDQVREHIESSLNNRLAVIA